MAGPLDLIVTVEGQADRRAGKEGDPRQALIDLARRHAVWTCLTLLEQLITTGDWTR